MILAAADRGRRPRSDASTNARVRRYQIITWRRSPDGGIDEYYTQRKADGTILFDLKVKWEPKKNKGK